MFGLPRGITFRYSHAGPSPPFSFGKLSYYIYKKKINLELIAEKKKSDARVPTELCDLLSVALLPVAAWVTFDLCVRQRRKNSCHYVS